MIDDLYQEQLDLAGRLRADANFATIPVLVQRKGVTDSDIEIALSTLNTAGGKIGLVIIVLMPELAPLTPDAPGPEYLVRPAIQVIEDPLLNLGADGTGISAEQTAQWIRQLIHYFAGRSGLYVCAGMEPVPRGDNRPSYGVRFSRRASDPSYQRCGLPLISPDSGAAPQTVTLTCATAGAALYYTVDGSYPSSANTAAHLYAAPFSVAAACTLRTAAEKSGLQQSGIAEATFT